MKLIGITAFLSTAILILSLLFSCEAEVEKIEKPSIDRATMVNLLADLHLFESTFHMVKKKKPAYRPEFNFQWLCRKYGITEQQFRDAVDYYASDPKVYEEICDEVIIRLTEMQANEVKRPGA